MSTFPGSPRILKGGIVLIDPDSGAVLRVIALKDDRDACTRSAPHAHCEGLVRDA
jgi:hypothetical protein